MKNSNNIEHNGKDKKAELMARMMDLLFSGEQLSEEERDGICGYLSDDKNALYNEEALFLYFSSKSKPDQPVGKSVFADEMWPEIAEAVGMNPDLDHYRAIRAAREKGSEEPATKDAPVRTLRRPSWRGVAARAAAVMLPIVFVVGGYLGWDALQSDGQGGGVVPKAVFVASQSVAAHPDSIRNIILADGTEVTLNRNSTLAYNENREAELSGEAYFKVAENPEHPFVIHSDHLAVTVLGTEFNFKADAESGNSTLSLFEGVVQLDNEAGSFRLDEGGREFTFDHATGVADIHDFDHTRKPQWMAMASSREPLLDIITLDQIFNLIETRYGVNIVNRAAVDTTRRFNFMLDDATAIEDVMLALQFVSGEFGYKINDKTITLEKN